MKGVKSPVYTDGDGASVYSGFTGGVVLKPTKLSMNARAFQSFRYNCILWTYRYYFYTTEKCQQIFLLLLRTKALSVLLYFNNLHFNSNCLLFSWKELKLQLFFHITGSFRMTVQCQIKQFIRTQEISMTTNRKFQFHDPDYNLSLHTYGNKT